MGRVVRGASCHGASCPWGELSMGRVVHGASCPWGELSMGRFVPGARCPGASFDGASCPWGELSWGEWSGNLKPTSGITKILLPAASSYKRVSERISVLYSFKRLLETHSYHYLWLSSLS